MHWEILQPHLFLEVTKVFRCLGVVLGHNLVTSAVVTNGVTEWQMNIHRQGPAKTTDTSLCEPDGVLFRPKGLDESIRRRIRRISGASHAKFLKDLDIDQ